MSHLIENEQFAYVGEAPWHGIGVDCPPGSTGAFMLDVAGLNWQVEPRTIAIADQVIDPEKNEPVFYMPGTGGLFRAIVRTDTNHIFQVATTFYQPVQNSQIIDFFHDYCEAGHATMETVGALRNGAVVWALAKLNGGSSAELAGGDKLKGYLLLATSHDGSMRTIGRATQIRVVCNNTLSAAISGSLVKGKDAAGVFSMMHTRKWDEVVKAEAQETMGMASEQVAKTNALAGELAKATIDEAGWMEFMGKLLGEDKVVNPKTAALMPMAQQIRHATVNSPGSDMISAKGTLWGAVNGVTYFADHVRGKSQDGRLAAAWFGDGDRLKRTAVTIAAEMAGASL